MPTASFVVTDIHGNAVASLSTFPHSVNRAGTSQVLRIGFSEVIPGGDTVVVAVTVTGTGSATVTTPLNFNSTTQTLELVVTGAATAGDFTVVLGAPTSTNPDFSGAAQAEVNFTNNDNEAVSGNVSPSEPTLHLPLDGAVVDSTAAVDFEWTHAFDQDKDELQYNLCVSSSEDMSNMKCVSVDETAIVAGSGVAGFDFSQHYLPGAFVASMLLVMLWKRFRSPKTQVVRRIMHLGALLLVCSAAFVACGNQKLLEALRVPDRPLVRATIPANTLLQSGSQHWRVYADDGKGNIKSSSQTRALDVQ